MFNESDIVLSAKHIVKQFPASGGRTLTACNDVNLNVYKGKTLGIVGESGCGKKNIVRMVNYHDKPTSGEISMFGYAGKDLSKVRSRVGCLIEAPGVYPNMTAKENIEMKCRLFGISKKGYAEGILDRVGLLNVGKKKT